jgi:hypothetical protein
VPDHRPPPAPVLAHREQVGEPVVSGGQAYENGARHRLAAQAGILGRCDGHRVPG